MWGRHRQNRSRSDPAAGPEPPEGGGGAGLPAMRASPAGGGAADAGPPDPAEGGGGAGCPAMGAIPGVTPRPGGEGAANTAL
jgi:hypothetical protein